MLQILHLSLKYTHWTLTLLQHFIREVNYKFCNFQYFKYTTPPLSDKLFSYYKKIYSCFSFKTHFKKQKSIEVHKTNPSSAQSHSTAQKKTQASSFRKFSNNCSKFGDKVTCFQIHIIESLCHFSGSDSKSCSNDISLDSNTVLYNALVPMFRNDAPSPSCGLQYWVQEKVPVATKQKKKVMIKTPKIVSLTS